MKKSIKSLARPIVVPIMNAVGQNITGPRKIRSYMQNLTSDQELKIIFGGHWRDEKGWLILRERDENITKKLSFSDESVDAIFTEHVVEHLSLADTVGFFAESKRILKRGGVLRTVCPILERMCAFNEHDPMVQSYVSAGLVPQFQKEENVLETLGLSMQDSPKIFLFNNIYLRTGHSFIWSAELMKKVLEAMGFRNVEIKKVTEGKYALERIARGVAKEDEGTPYDPESLAIEAIK